MKSLLLPLSLSLLLPLSPLLRAEPWTAPLDQLRKVGPEGAGNVQAAAAWTSLTAPGPELLGPVRHAIEGASPPPP